MVADHENTLAGASRRRTRHVRTLVIPLVLAVGMVAGAAGLVTTGVGCSDGDGPRPDGHPGDGDIDTPIV
jgi:hypothetical protein